MHRLRQCIELLLARCFREMHEHGRQWGRPGRGFHLQGLKRVLFMRVWPTSKQRLRTTLSVTTYHHLLMRLLRCFRMLLMLLLQNASTGSCRGLLQTGLSLVGLPGAGP